MAQITYADKVALNENPNINVINKVRDIDMNEIKEVVNNNETKILLAVVDTAPAQCSTGDMYFNTTSKKIFTATGTDTWGNTGEDPTENTIYVVIDTQTSYIYNGTTLVSVGGGAGGGIVVAPDTPTEDTKLYIESMDLDAQYEVNEDKYSTNETLTNKIWIDGKPIYRKVISVNNQRVASDETIAHGISNMGTLISIKGMFYDGSVYREYPTINVSAEPQLLNCGANSTNITFYGNVSWGASATRIHTFVLEYTKTTD